MKKLQISLVLIIFLCIATAFSVSDTTPNEAAIKMVKNQFHTGLSDFSTAIKNLSAAAEIIDGSSANTKKLQVAHLETRLAFKRIEFFLEYFDRYSVKKTLNGAPLLGVEPKVPEVVIIEPRGLQVLDELVFSDDLKSERLAIQNQIQQLAFDFSKIYKFQKNIDITHRFIFEASRQELIRIFSLGLTGFDTPGSANAIPEAKASMQSIKDALMPYIKMGSERKFQHAATLQNNLEQAITYLDKNQDFDSFDRMYFLRNFTDPLYNHVYQLQRFLNVETIKEVEQTVQSINEEAQSIFDPEFLNKSFYANMDFNNPLIQKRIELGRILFFDPILSNNLERSCASCHKPEKAFTDGLAKSLAMGGESHIDRNAPTIINSVFSERYFYDLREPKLENQIQHVVFSKEEFASNFFEVTKKLKQSNDYKKLFAEAYPDYPKYQFTKWSISDALAAYVTNLSYFNSPVDQYIRKEIQTIDPDVVAGFNLFMGKAACGTCHFAPTFNGSVPPIFDESESEVLGVPVSKDTLNPVLDLDPGRRASGRPIDAADFYLHSFKTVTVRNIAETGPYMHNGVYDSLEEVVDFYNKGGGIGLGLDVPYQTLPDTPLNLTQKEKDQLVIFMEALSDEAIDTSRPDQLPSFENNPSWNERVVGGKY